MKLTDLKLATARFFNVLDAPTQIDLSPAQYRAYLRAAHSTGVLTTHEALKLLFNAGARNKDLRL